MFCPKQERIVAPDEIVRGYELGPDRYLPITDEELLKLKLKEHARGPSWRGGFVSLPMHGGYDFITGELPLAPDPLFTSFPLPIV